MSVITESAQGTLRAIRARTHPNCMVCGRANGRGPQLEFHTCADGSVQATFDCRDSYEGYANVVHGGVVSALLDKRAQRRGFRRSVRSPQFGGVRSARQCVRYCIRIRSWFLVQEVYCIFFN